MAEIAIIADSKLEAFTFWNELEKHTHFPIKYHYYIHQTNEPIEPKFFEKCNLIITLNYKFPIIVNRNIVIWNTDSKITEHINRLIYDSNYITQYNDLIQLSILISKFILLDPGPHKKSLKRKHQEPQQKFKGLRIIIPDKEPEPSDLMTISTPIYVVPKRSI